MLRRYSRISYAQTAGPRCWVWGTQGWGSRFSSRGKPQGLPLTPPAPRPLVICHHPSHGTLRRQPPATDDTTAPLPALAFQHILYFDNITTWGPQDVSQEWNTTRPPRLGWVDNHTSHVSAVEAREQHPAQPSSLSRRPSFGELAKTQCTKAAQSATTSQSRWENSQEHRHAGSEQTRPASLRSSMGELANSGTDLFARHVAFVCCSAMVFVPWGLSHFESAHPRPECDQHQQPQDVPTSATAANPTTADM